MDKLEKWIIDNREGLNDKSPPADLWSRIEKDLPVHPAPTSLNWKLWAGLGILLIGIIVSTVLYMNRSGESLSEEIEMDPMLFAKMEEYKQSQNYFLAEAEEYTKELVSMTNDTTIIRDLEQLDLMQKELQEELKSAVGPHKEFIIDALIENHQVKISLLQHLLEDLKNAKKDESQYPIL
jgi:hypothetical protein